MWNIVFPRRRIWVLLVGAHSQMNTTVFKNRPGETYNWTNLHLEPHDYRTLIYVVSMEFLSLSRRRSPSRNVPQRRWARRNVCRSQSNLLFVTFASSKNRLPATWFAILPCLGDIFVWHKAFGLTFTSQADKLFFKFHWEKPTCNWRVSIWGGRFDCWQ